MSKIPQLSARTLVTGMSDQEIIQMAVDHLGIDYDRMPPGVLTLVRACLNIRC